MDRESLSMYITKMARSKTNQEEDTIKPGKLKQVYVDCLRNMKAGEHCERVSEREGGLDECIPFGTPPWDTYKWTENEKEIVKENVGDEQYAKTLACLKSKAQKIANKNHQKRVRMNSSGPSGQSKPRSKKSQTSGKSSGKSKP